MWASLKKEKKTCFATLSNIVGYCFTKTSFSKQTKPSHYRLKRELSFIRIGENFDPETCGPFLLSEVNAFSLS